VTPDGYPYCGAELLPHAEFADGSPAPIVCDLPVHGLSAMHRNEELGTWWAWQNAAAPPRRTA